MAAIDDSELGCLDVFLTYDESGGMITARVAQIPKRKFITSVNNTPMFGRRIPGKYLTTVEFSWGDNDLKPRLLRQLKKRLGCKGKLRGGIVYLFGPHAVRVAGMLSSLYDELADDN